MKKLVLILFLFYSSHYLQAQPGKNLQAQKVAYFTDNLGLTPEEAAKFWPLYNEMRSQIKATRLEEMENRDIADMTEVEASKFIDDQLLREEKVLSIKKKYATEMRKVLPAKKVAMLPGVERKFNRELIKRISRRK